jgi:hypothetical protein
VKKNGTALIRGKSVKHDNLVNASLLVKYIRPRYSQENLHQMNSVKKEDGGPVTRSRSQLTTSYA